MIPKTIHYCWFGGKPLSEKAKKCIESWKKYCPDYQIIEWNESNFDVNKNRYCREAYMAKKWAFVSDYARFWILYNYGGLYFDVDVEIIKNIDDIVMKGAFMGAERSFPINVNPGLGLAAKKGMSVYREILNLYEEVKFINDDNDYNMTTVVQYVTGILRERGLKDVAEIQKVQDIYIYPVEYFCPKDIETGKLKITNNTYSIHHYDASWYSNKQIILHKTKIMLINIFGAKFVLWIKKILNL